MDKDGRKIRGPLSEEEEARLLGGNVFGIDVLFDGDFAMGHPAIREYWTIGMVQEWQELMASLRLDNQPVAV